MSLHTNSMSRRELFRTTGTLAMGVTVQYEKLAPTVACADDFVKSVGVNVHLGYGRMLSLSDTVIASALRDLGARHIRDGAVLAKEGVAALGRICRELNVQVTLICDPTNGSVAEAISVVRDHYGPKLVAAVEGVNEPEGWFSTQVAAGRDPLRTAANYQRQLFAGMKADPVLDGIPIYGPSLIYADSVPRMRQVASVLEMTNLHPYPGGRHPETEGWGDRLRGAAYGSLEYSQLNLGKALRPTVPSVITETGYWNARSSNGVPEEVAALYLPRLLLNSWNKGIRRTFIYQLMDGETNSEPQASSGLVRYDGSRKPSFESIRHLIKLFSDPGPPFPTTQLRYSIEDAAPDTRSVLMQKRDGSFYLALWRAVQVWDPDRQIALPYTRQDSTLVFFKTVKQIAVTSLTGTHWNILNSVDRIPISLGADVTVVSVSVE